MFSNCRVRIGLMLAGLAAAAAGPIGAESPQQISPQQTLPSGGPVDFAREVLPLLRRSCLDCHGPTKQEGDLRLDRRSDAVASRAIVPGQPEQSELLRRVALDREDPEVMPARGAPLSPAQVGVLRRWIAAGAAWPEKVAAPPHWSYQRPVAAPLPEVSLPAWPRTPIDFFVLRQIDEQGGRPAPPAPPSTLIRRVYLDLIGLPPPPAAVAAFEAAPSPEAYERIVDQLLQSPQFGERWARPWLDLARYADSHGFQRDDFRDSWAYRDWVIRALNADMPFDQFTIEQLAGDLLPDATPQQRIATGFHRASPTNCEAGSLPEETRTEQLIDRVNTTGAVWLGATLECAQCHDHKYDPFSARDYYRLLAFFNQTELEADLTDAGKPSSIQFRGPTMEVPDAQRGPQRAALDAKLASLKKRLAVRRRQLAEDLGAWAAEASAEAGRSQTIALEITDFQSLGAADTYERLDDGAVLLVGDSPPEHDLYTVTVRADLADIRAIRLDVLTHPSLPGGGPGRGDPQRTNFILNEFSAHLADAALAFRGATADYSQPRWDVAQAIDGRAKTGWAIAPQFGKPHWARFVLAQPLDASGGRELTFRLSQQFGNSRTIGCFRLSAVTGSLEVEPAPAELSQAAATPEAQWSPKLRNRVAALRAERDSEASKLERQVKQAEVERAALAPATSLVMVEASQRRPSYVYTRGDYRQRGEPVTPGTPPALHPLRVAGETGEAGEAGEAGETSESGQPANRLTLARWLVDPANPLVARVTVNRWWAELFGEGLVATVEDFGLQGEPPSHPQLLDWLAVDFMERGWSMKRTLRTIVLSSTYCQSSVTTPEMLERDDRNRRLARGPRFRMDAEMIRDNALAISGLLSDKQFGPPIRPFQPQGIWSKVGGVAYQYELSPPEDRYRRGIYVVHKRGAPYPSFVNFDAAARLACTVKRSRTNTPLQALTLLNDPVYTEAAHALARRLLTEPATALAEDTAPERNQLDQLDRRLDYGFRLATARRPTAAERQVLRRLFQQFLERHVPPSVPQQGERESLPAAAPLVAAPQPLPAGVSAEQYAAWHSIATTLLNLHETISKE